MAVHYYPLINRMLTTLQISERLSFLNRAKPEDAFTRPFITIAREPGSGGAPIAKAVAKKLGFAFVDEQIVDEIARSTKKRKQIIQAVDEKSRPMIDDWLHSLLNTDYVNDLKYVTELVRVVLTYAHQGHVVILGRGANFITPFEKGLHVNITAPYKLRVERAIKYEGFTKAKAKSVIAKTEAERKAFVKQYLNKDITKVNAYDLSINTTCFEIKQSRDLIIEAFYRKFSRSVRYGAFIKR